MPFYLPARPPFSLAAVLGSHGWLQLAPFEADASNGGFSYAMRLASGRVVRLRVAEAPGGVEVSATASSRPAAAEPSGEEQAEIERAAAYMLGLDLDLSAFYEAARHEPKLARAAERAQGRILRSATLFEDTVKTILTTNTLWGGTKRMVGALVAGFGDPLDGDPACRAFPTPARLAAAGAETLAQEARLGYRSPHVARLARAVDSGELDLEGLRTAGLPTPELRRRLLQIAGVGPYAAANLLMLMGRYDCIPVDSWAMKMVSQEFHAGQPAGPAEVEGAFARWGEWKGLAYWFWAWSE